MWDKRIVGLAAVLAGLACTVLFFLWVEANTVCGLPLGDEERLRQRYSSAQYIEYPENASELLYFEGNSIPYDTETNSFYIPQSINSRDFEGRFSVSDNGVRAWLLRDGYEHDKAAGVREGHAYRIWISAGDTVSIGNIVFTGLPVVSVTTDSGRALTTNYHEGRIGVWSPEDEDFGTISDRSSAMDVKASASDETVTCKLRTEKRRDHKRVSLLNMGKYDAWKLYKIPGKDPTGIRMMLAYYLWNEISNGERLDAPCRFVELVENGAYEGLCILRPRMDDDYFGLPDKSMLVETEDAPEETLYGKYEPVNLAEYGVWLQAACAYANIYDDLYILTPEKNESYFLPGKPEHIFGLFSKQQAYLSYQYEKRIITADELHLTGAEAECFEKDAAERWTKLRGTVLSDENIDAAARELSAALVESGFAAREGLAESGLEMLLTQTKMRYANIDAYYDGK